MNEELKDATYLGDYNGRYSDNEVFLESDVLENFLKAIKKDKLIAQP